MSPPPSPPPPLLLIIIGEGIFVSASHQSGLDTRSITRRSDYSGDLGRGRSGMSRGSSPAGLCWLSAHLVQCGPDEPCWTWTQIWVQVHMPDYCLNWTARSSVIQKWQRCQCCSSPTRRWPSRSQGAFGLKFALLDNACLGQRQQQIKFGKDLLGGERKKQQISHTSTEFNFWFSLTGKRDGRWNYVQRS